MRTAIVTGFLVLCTACGSETTGSTIKPPTEPDVVESEDGPVAPFVVGRAQVNPPVYIEYTPGDAPLVVISPHDGQTAGALPDRTCPVCVPINDVGTQDIARLIVERFQAATGARPHLIVNRLQRIKFDANREINEATGGNVALQPSWRWFHAAIDSAKNIVQRQHQRGLVVDIHGHLNPVNRVELGYLLSEVALRASDGELSAANAMDMSSVARLARDTRSTPDRGVALLRGPNSFGAMLMARGYRAVPSPADAAPQVNEGYFDGGYNTFRHGSVSGAAVDAIQLEMPYPGVRDTDANRRRYVDALVPALQQYLSVHYGWTGAR